MLKALLLALLEPTAKLRELEINGDFTSRLALLEEIKTLPFGAVWDYHCQKQRRAGRRGVAGRGRRSTKRRARETSNVVTSCVQIPCVTSMKPLLPIACAEPGPRNHKDTTCHCSPKLTRRPIRRWES